MQSAALYKTYRTLHRNAVLPKRRREGNPIGLSNT